MHVIDRRMRKKGGIIEQLKSPGAVDILNPFEKIQIAPIVVEAGGEGGDAPGDNGGWLDLQRGNRINRMVGTPGEDAFGPYLLERVFG